MTDYSKRVTVPSPDAINTYCHAARVSTMQTVLGTPKLPLSNDCANDRASPKVEPLLQTRSVGPFRVTGIAPFLDLLTRVFARVKRDNPELYGALGTAGLLCVRYVRGSNSQISNHSWGTAIDMTMRNPNTGKQELDPRGDGKVQLGCLELYKFFKADGLATGEWCFWGAGFPVEDGMHFEASDELIQMWKSQGRV